VDEPCAVGIHRNAKKVAQKWGGPRPGGGKKQGGSWGGFWPNRVREGEYKTHNQSRPKKPLVKKGSTCRGQGTQATALTEKGPVEGGGKTEEKGDRGRTAVKGPRKTVKTKKKKTANLNSVTGEKKHTGDDRR